MSNLMNRTKRVAVMTLLATLPAISVAELNDDERAMANWIDAHSEDAISLLKETVNISSGSLNVEGVRQVADVMRVELESLGLETEWIALPKEMQRAGHLVGRKDGEGKRFLMIGHLDTVFEADDEFQAFSRDGNIATGPGIDDMKSGNVVIVYALKALQQIGALESLPVVVFYTGKGQ